MMFISIFAPILAAEIALAAALTASRSLSGSPGIYHVSVGMFAGVVSEALAALSAAGVCVSAGCTAAEGAAVGGAGVLEAPGPAHAADIAATINKHPKSLNLFLPVIFLFMFILLIFKIM